VINCPFGVIDRRQDDGRAWKCTLCYDRLKEDMKPACAKACPTESIHFGEIGELQRMARRRVADLHERGMHEAYLYGDDAQSQPGTEGLNAFFLLVDKPEVYNLPPDPVVPTKRVKETWISFAYAAVGLAAAAVASVVLSKGGR
jgi:formate dehydrogenase iron-sulfur subunit